MYFKHSSLVWSTVIVQLFVGYSRYEYLHYNNSSMSFGNHIYRYIKLKQYTNMLNTISNIKFKWDIWKYNFKYYVTLNIYNDWTLEWKYTWKVHCVLRALVFLISWTHLNRQTIWIFALIWFYISTIVTACSSCVKSSNLSGRLAEFNSQ